MPTVRQPLSLAIGPTTDPTAPAAPLTRTVSPAAGRPPSRRPKYPVRPTAPTAERKLLGVGIRPTSILRSPCAGAHREDSSMALTPTTQSPSFKAESA